MAWVSLPADETFELDTTTDEFELALDDDTPADPVQELRETLRVDVLYAIKQLKRHGDIQRALDALERVEAALYPERA